LLPIFQLRRQFLSFSVILVLAFSAVAQNRGPNRVAGAVPTVERLRAHIEYLASDKLEGRRTGSPGANLAAEYIAREFSRYGLRRSIGYDTAGMSILEADSPNRYLQKFPYVAGVELGKNNVLTLSPKSGAKISPQVRDAWIPLGISSSGQVEDSPVVFVGYGITASELNMTTTPRPGPAAGSHSRFPELRMEITPTVSLRSMRIRAGKRSRPGMRVRKLCS